MGALLLPGIIYIEGLNSAKFTSTNLYLLPHPCDRETKVSKVESDKELKAEPGFQGPSQILFRLAPASCDLHVLELRPTFHPTPYTGPREVHWLEKGTLCVYIGKAMAKAHRKLRLTPQNSKILSGPKEVAFSVSLVPFLSQTCWCGSLTCRGTAPRCLRGLRRW